MPELSLKTQEISMALGRGKHTTRHTELYRYNEGYIVDTPGFSKIEFQIFHADELKALYPDFVIHAEHCRFKSDCMHLSEPGCEVKRLVDLKVIPQSRYDIYQLFINEIKEQKEKY
jgi:ribosome biogenesis GTPase / thiamine phosphate phosphatase